MLKPKKNDNQTPDSSNKSLKVRQARQKRIKTIMELLGYPTGSFGIAGTIYLWKTGEPYLAIVTAFASLGLIVLAMAAKWVSDVFNRVLDRIEERLQEKVDPLADYIVEGLEEYVIKNWWKLTSQFQGKYYQNLIHTYRTYQTQGLKTPISFWQYHYW